MPDLSEILQNDVGLNRFVSKVSFFPKNNSTIDYACFSLEDVEKDHLGKLGILR